LPSHVKTHSIWLTVIHFFFTAYWLYPCRWVWKLLYLPFNGCNYI
jgi:hypothetical protein